MENDVTVMVEDQPEISQWTERDVLNWIERSGLSKIKGIKEIFESNNVNGQKLLTITEEELKWNCFNITSLGRRKNIIRSINFLKANACRSMNNGISMLESARDGAENDFNVNRSANAIQPFTDRSNLGMPSMDRSAILSSAQNFFKSKGREPSTSITNDGNRLHYNDRSFDSARLRATNNGNRNPARSVFDGNMTYI